MDDESRVVDYVTRFYLESADFNGVPAWQLAEYVGMSPDRSRHVIATLITEGNLSAVFSDRQPNPHIKAFEDEPIEVQIKKLKRASLEEFCLYPTPPVLAAVVNPTTYHGRPFTSKLALGEPQLDFGDGARAGNRARAFWPPAKSVRDDHAIQWFRRA